MALRAPRWRTGDRSHCGRDGSATAGAGARTLTLDIDFQDKLPRVVERTGWLGKFHLVAQWFPKIAVLELPGERGATAGALERA